MIDTFGGKCNPDDKTGGYFGSIIAASATGSNLKSLIYSCNTLSYFRMTGSTIGEDNYVKVLTALSNTAGGNFI